MSGLLNRADVDTIYVCTDSGVKRVHLPPGGADGRGKERTAVAWIDSRWDEILPGRPGAKDLAEH